MFTQVISIDRTKEQHEKYLKDELLKMGYIEEGFSDLGGSAMSNLLDFKGKKFSCRICGTKTSGTIQVEDGYVYLCQNDELGRACSDKLGYRCSWYVRDGGARALKYYGVDSFKIIKDEPNNKVAQLNEQSAIGLLKELGYIIFKRI